MMLTALEALKKARMQGTRPAVVMVTLYPAVQSPWWHDGTMVEIVIPDDVPLPRLDFRPLVRCDVIVIAKRRDERLRKAVEMICAEASRVTVLAGCDPDVLGHVWERGIGWRVFAETEREAV